MLQDRPRKETDQPKCFVILFKDDRGLSFHTVPKYHEVSFAQKEERSHKASGRNKDVERWVMFRNEERRIRKVAAALCGTGAAPQELLPLRSAASGTHVSVSPP